MNTPAKLTILLLVVALFFLQYPKASGQSALIWEEQARLSSIRDSIKLVDGMNRVGLLYQAKSIDSCFYYGMKAKALAGRLHYAKGEIDADNVIGTAFSCRGLYREALAVYSAALTGYRQLNDTSNIVQVLMNMALVYAVIPDSIKSESFFRQAMKAGEHLKQDSILSLLYVNYCMFTPLQSNDSASYYLGKSSAIARRYKMEWIPILVMQIQATRLLQQGHREEALSLIEESLHKSRAISMELLEMNSLVSLGDYHKNNADSALKYYQQAYQLVKESGYMNMMIPASRAILETTRLTGNAAKIDQAHGVLEEALTKENENLKNFIGDYVKYNMVEEDNKLLEISNRNNQAKIWLLIALCGVSALLVAFIYRQYRVLHRLNQKISEQNNNLQTTLSVLEQSQEENTRIMRIVAHDLRSPIGAMTSIATLLLQEAPRSEDDEMMLNLIKTAGENSLELTSDLLLINSRAEELKKEAVDMYQLIHYCVDLLQFKAGIKNQKINLHASHTTSYVNREKIWRVISNLITNAIKFSPDGANIGVQLEEKQDEVEIVVKDNGIGIPAEMQGKIFQMFTETKRRGTAGEESFGLGLAISRQIVEAHKGRIWFESVPGSGTTFFVTLPKRNPVLEKAS
ncbi:HAMP domain-containing histidine kinase [Chitinophaga ginsengisegetis]|uniref:sensor histidine kinase n=1 Tax=Chitinophaga ginsengisegetis TaxID=393003 RepID=UPI00343A9708